MKSEDRLAVFESNNNKQSGRQSAGVHTWLYFKKHTYMPC